MPTRFLSHSEIERLESFPEEIDRDDLAEHFRLAGKDLEFVRSQYGSEGQLGIAVQLCALRWLGFVPEDLSAPPAAAVQSLRRRWMCPRGRCSIIRCGHRLAGNTARWFAGMRTGGRSGRLSRRRRAGGWSGWRSSMSARRCCWQSCAGSCGRGGSSGPRSTGWSGWWRRRESALTTAPSSCWPSS